VWDALYHNLLHQHGLIQEDEPIRNYLGRSDLLERMEEEEEPEPPLEREGYESFLLLEAKDS
jgi:hypothetical protein